MGCNNSSEEETPQPQVFSWDRQDQLDPKDYTISDKTGGVYGRLPGKINGQQFIIENCKDVCIYLFDYSATVTIDKCVNCNIFIGPSKGSVFIRNSTDCVCYIACQQFRTRECHKLEVYLLCDTQPIIEVSSGMKFGCFQLSYMEIEEQLKNAGLSVFNNSWYNIHDFTPLEHGCNWSIIKSQARKHLPDSLGDEFSSIDVSYDTTKSVVPLSCGKMSTLRYDDSCLVVFFYTSKLKCTAFLRELTNVTSYDLIQSKEIQLSPEDISRVFKHEKYSKLAKYGPLIGLQLNGDRIIKCGEEVLQTLGLSIDYVYISVDQVSAKQDIDSFYNFVDMSMI